MKLEELYDNTKTIEQRIWDITTTKDKILMAEGLHSTIEIEIINFGKQQSTDINQVGLQGVWFLLLLLSGSKLKRKKRQRKRN